MDRTVIVSNRVPKLDGAEPDAGGLAVGLRAALEETGGLWLGWSGRIADGSSGGCRIERSTPFTLATVDLTEAEHAGFYRGFSNRVLWPLLHGRTDLMRFDPADLATYRAVNARFARQLASRTRPRDLIWVHDYHFLLLGRELRRAGVEAPLGFFLHVPFPPARVFEALPCRDDLIQAMSTFDLIGFQTNRDVENFRELVLQRLGGTATDDGLVLACGRRIRLGAFPIGIDTERFAALAASPEAGRLCDRLQGCFEGNLGAVGADRLDYTKGIAQRLRAFERLLATATDFRQRAFLLQIAAPSREAVPEYSDLRVELEALSGRINARYADVDWTPVRFLNRTFSHTRLAALFRLSRVGFVTPLRDGMNLVAKEYVAAQDADDPGVLVLSRFAGAAEQLDAALIVDPYDIDGVAQALRDAFAMPLEERRARWTAMMMGLRTHDVHDWRDRFLHGLKTARCSIIRALPRLAVNSVGAPAEMGPSGHRRQPAFRLHPEGTVPRVDGI